MNSIIILPRFRFLSFLFLINTQLLHALSTPQFITKFWKRNEEEIISKEYEFTAQPLILLNNTWGNITINGSNQNKVLLEAKKSGTKDELQNTEIITKNQKKRISISSKTNDNNIPAAFINYKLDVPKNSIVKLRIHNKGNIIISNLEGSLDVSTHRGSIEINDSSNNVTARSEIGTITVNQKIFEDTGIIFLEARRGNIILNLPQNINATIHAKVKNGQITSEYPITLHPLVFEKLNEKTWKLAQREIKGNIGAGGAPITLETTYGSIKL